LVTDPFMDYDESDSECSVLAARSASVQHDTPYTNGSMQCQFEVPTTNLGLMSMNVAMKDRSFILLHAVLNNCGTLLVQTQSKLSGTL
jgi:hypothetical protein